MDKYQCEYLVIFLICFRSLAAQGFEYVTRGKYTQFGSLLCSPGTYISVRKVYGCTSVRVTSHCGSTGSQCDAVFNEDHEYYQLVVSKCDSRVACTGLNAGSYRIRSSDDCNEHYTYYTTIKYQCLPVEQDYQATEYVTRDRYKKFGSPLCSPGTYINIRGVYGCSSKTSHCGLRGSSCIMVYAYDNEYYQQVFSKCNGRVACTDLDALYTRITTTGCYRYNTEYTTIEYQCLPADQYDQGAHYHYHAIQFPGSSFPDLYCPDNTYINMTDVLLGDKKDPYSVCAAQPEDCVQSSLGSLIQGMATCNGLTACSGLTINQPSGYQCEGRRRATDYHLLFYQCLQNPSDVHYRCQSGINKTLTAPEGTVVSPGYPGQYYNNTNCRFLIRASVNQIIKVKFNEFNLEGRDDSDQCYDYLDVYDGLSYQAHNTPRGRFCGDTLPNPITSTGNGLLISFHSDGSHSAGGFTFVWRFIETTEPTIEDTTRVTTSDVTTLDTTPVTTFDVTTLDTTPVTTSDVTTLDTTPPPSRSSRQPEQTTQTVLTSVTDGKTLPESINKDLVMYIVIAVAALAVIAIIISVTIIMVKRRNKPRTESLHAPVTYDNHQGQATIGEHSPSHTGRQAVENVYDFDNQELTSFGYSATGHNNDILPDYENTTIQTRDLDLAPSQHAFSETIYQNYNPREANRQRAHVEVAPSGEVYSLVQKTAKRHTEDDYELAQNISSDYADRLSGGAYNSVDKNEREYGTVLVDNATYGST